MSVWQNLTTLDSKNYVCGHCGKPICSGVGYHSNRFSEFVYICHNCEKPTYLNPNEQVPGPLIGAMVADVPKDLDLLYNEVRRSYSVNAFTASVMTCRKIIMHIAVSKNAKPGLSFIDYVEYLNSNHFIPPDGKEWVDHIRTKGNEANHDIVIMEEDDASDLISFIEMLLRFIYEFPARVKSKTVKTP